MNRRGGLPIPRLLQLGSLLVIWLQAWLSGYLPWSGALALPPLLLLNLRQRPLPQKALRLLTVLLLILWASAVQWLDSTQWLLQLGCLLWIMAGLKLLEARDTSGWRNAALVLLFGLGISSSLTQALGASLMQVIAALLCVSSLLAIEASQQPLRQLLRRSLLIGITCVPLIIVALILLPRLPAVWTLQGLGSGTTGLSEELRPGELAFLVQSKGLAARVSFRGNPPDPEKRYWRVLVHQDFDGSGWQLRSQQMTLNTAPQVREPIEQRWLVEPNRLHWYPWSGAGVPNDPELRQTSIGTLWSPKASNSRRQYGIGEAPNSRSWRAEPPTESDLAYPAGVNPQLEALAREWTDQTGDAEQLLRLAEEWFRSQKFIYTLEPGKLPNIAPLDQFLFSSRRGFCEHYAASFSALMRAAGVPARVTVGYQGGDWTTPIGGEPFLLINNSDAHAWSEIWLQGRGWTEIDPTSWVVPERVRRSLAASLNAEDRQKLRRALPDWLANLSSQWQLLDYRWQLWVMGLDSSRQQEFIDQWLGRQQHWQGLIGVFAVGGCLAVGVFFLQPRTPAKEPVRQALDQCLRIIESQRGLALNPGETLQKFSQRAIQHDPDLAYWLDQLADIYNQVRFDPRGISTRQALHKIKWITRRIEQHEPAPPMNT